MQAVNLKRRIKLFSSFWLWFAGALLFNQIILIALLVFYVQSSFSTSIASIIVSMAEAVRQIKTETGQAGLLKFQQTIAPLANIRLLEHTVDHEEKLKYPGSRAITNKINEISAGQLTAKFSDKGAPTITVSMKNDPSLNLSIQALGKIEIPFIVSMVFIALLVQSAIAAYWIATRITAPLQALSDQAKRLATGDDLLRIEVEKKSSPEIKALSITLNEMRCALDAMITDREQILGSIAHDLRTPLSRLGIGLELIKNKSPAAVESLLGDVSEMGMFLSQFIELSKLNQEIDERWVSDDAKQLIFTILEKYARAGVEIKLLDDNAPAFIQYKPLALTRLIYNLIDNAVRHGSGDIKLHIRSLNDEVLLSVENAVTSKTEPQSGLTKAFEATHVQNSSGLGLKIIQQFAKVHNATLYESRNDLVQIFTLHFKVAVLNS